jgi:cell division inhibitor SulA
MNTSTQALPADDTLALWFHVRLTPGLSRKDRRRYYRALHRHLKPLHLLLAQGANFCVVLAVGRALRATDRHAVVDWLIDQPQTECIQLSDLIPLGDLRHGVVEVSFAEQDAQRNEVLVNAVHRILCHLVDDACLLYAAATLNLLGHPAE